MATILLEGLHFHYNPPFNEVFEGLDLSLDSSWRTGLVGRNGRGKTTLLRLLAGELKPSRGTVQVPLATLRFPLKPEQPARARREVVRELVAPFENWEAEMERLLAAGDEASLTTYGEIQERYQEAGGYEIEAKVERELAALGLDGEACARPFETLSPGERTRALIAGLFLTPGVFPLVDEPTNHLDLEGRDRLGRYLAQQEGYLLVSHDRHFLDLCCDHVLSINKSDLQLHRGSYTNWREQVERIEANERLREANLRREIRGLEASARRRRGWSGLKEKQKVGGYDKGRIGKLAARHMKRALATEKQREEKLEEKRALLQNAEKERKVRLTAEKSPERVMTVDGASLGYDGRPLIEGLSFHVDRGDRLAVVGPNGCGKSTLLRAILGELPLLSGHLHLPGHLDVARGHQEPLWGTGLLRDHLRASGVDETLFRTTMAGLGVTGEIFDRELETFSMGELKKVDLTRSFLKPHHLLLWDEPMNYVDLDSREDIEEVILAEQPTMIFVEHDRWFVERIATAVLDLGD